MQAEIILYLIIFLYGIVIGSFLNVLIYRIPIKENIATDRSHCTKCGAVIKWYDLVPLFSYIFLRGRCRNCDAKISIQYPLIEAFNGFGYVLIFAIKGFSWQSILFCITYSILIVISFIDFRTYEIPFALNIVIAVLGVINIMLDNENLSEYLIGFCSVSGFMFIVLLTGRAVKGIDAFGGGDIKLMAAAGLLLGWKNIILAFLIGCILGAVIHSIRMKVSGQEHVLAFGPYLCAGILIAMMYGDTLISWYIGLLA